MKKLAVCLLYGCLAAIGVIGAVRLLSAAIPQGASVLYTGPDLVLMPTGTTFSSQILNALGPFTTSSSFTAGSTIALTGIITPTQITASQNNYNPTGLATATVVRLSTSASWNLTGLLAGSDGALKLIHNIGVQNLVLVAESGSSTAANRFDFPGDLTLIPKAMAVLQYDGTSLRWRSSFPTLTAGPVSASWVDYTIQTTDPAPPAANILRDYAKTGGKHTRDSAGNIVGPMGTGGGGGTGVGLTVRLITTTNITRSGEQTIEGILTSGTRVLVAGQTTPTENGILVTGPGAWTRATDAAAGATFTAGTQVTISDGIAGPTGNKGTCWMYTSSGSYNTSALTAIKSCLGPTGELLSNKGAPSGYPSLGSDSMVTWTQIGSRANALAVATASAITPTATTMGVEGSSGPVTMTSADPRITGCTLASHHGRRMTLKGIHPTNTVTMPNGNGVRLCGNTGSVTLGLNRSDAQFVCDGTTPEWQQVGCGDLQTAFNTWNEIETGATEDTGFIWGKTATGNYCTLFADAANGNQPTTTCYCGGVICPATTIKNLAFGAQGTQGTCDSTRRFHSYPTAGGAGVADKLEVCIKSSADTYAWTTMLGGGGGGGTKTVSVRLEPVLWSNNVAWVPPERVEATNLMFIRQVLDDQSTRLCAFWQGWLSTDIASTENWKLRLVHKARSGAAANVVVDVSAQVGATGGTFDTPSTSLLNDVVVAVNTSAQRTITTLPTSGSFDTTLPLTGDRSLVLELCREAANGSDTMNSVPWDILDVVLVVDVNT